MTRFFLSALAALVLLSSSASMAQDGQVKVVHNWLADGNALVLKVDRPDQIQERIELSMLAAFLRLEPDGHLEVQHKYSDLSVAIMRLHIMTGDQAGSGSRVQFAQVVEFRDTASSFLGMVKASGRILPFDFIHDPEASGVSFELGRESQIQVRAHLSKHKADLDKLLRE